MEETNVSAREAAIELLKATPPTSIVSLKLAGITLSDWVFLLGAALMILQLYFLLRDKWWRQRKRGKRK